MEYMSIPVDEDDGLGAVTKPSAQPKPLTPHQQQQLDLAAAQANVGMTQKYVIMGAVVLLAGVIGWRMLYSRKG